MASLRARLKMSTAAAAQGTAAAEVAAAAVAVPVPVAAPAAAPAGAAVVPGAGGSASRCSGRAGTERRARHLAGAAEGLVGEVRGEGRDTSKRRTLVDDRALCC